jgi:hypothetical protein
VLRLVFTFGWLPALVGAHAAFLRPGPARVVNAAGAAAMPAVVGLVVTLAILAAGYASALRRPPRARTVVVAAAGSILVGLAMPVLFSADAYAYAYYGDLALHGRDPYGHAAAAVSDSLAAAAVVAWDGHIPPRCVYGPLAVGIAALADAGASAWGVAGQILAQRAAAAVAYGVYAACILRLVAAPRARVAYLLNPVVIWSVAEGHNDAPMTALAALAFVTARGRTLCLTLAALVKAPAVVVWTRLASRRDLVLAAGATILGYLPLGAAVWAAGTGPAAGGGAAWESPLGLVAAAVGRPAALLLGSVALAAVAVGTRRLAAAERIPAFALAAWFALPNAYPWYALWIVPLAARNRSAWSRALLCAALAAPARAISDAVSTAPAISADAEPFVRGMIALEYLPPLLVLAAARVRRGVAAAGAAALLAALACRAPAGAQSLAPSPIPAAAPATPPAASASGAATPLPTPSAPAQPSPQEPPPQAAPQMAPPAAPPATPQPSPSVAAAPSPSAAAASGAAAPTPNPFGYIITPTPAPATEPDGPHILEVELNDRRIRAGGPLMVRVITSANVVGVEARALGRFIAIPQSSPGLFALAYTLPGAIPFWLLNRNYDIVIAAATADGRQTSVSFPMLLTR